MNNSAERKAAKIADEFLNAELDDDANAQAWLVKKIAAENEKAERAGYVKAMCRRF
jgi:hypothetical protein